MKKLEMVYGDSDAAENEYGGKLLFTGTYKGIVYAVVNRAGWHPCGYIEVTGTKFDECEEFNKLKKEDRENYCMEDREKYSAAQTALDYAVNEGLTYSGGWCNGVYMPKLMDNHTRWFVGWDYGHLDDKHYYGYNNPLNHPGKKWTTDEVIAECKRCISALLKECKKD